MSDDTYEIYAVNPFMGRAGNDDLFPNARFHL